MSSGNECRPDYWFLGEKEKVEITLRETGALTVIPQNQLLDERSEGWKWMYCMKMPPAERVLYTASNSPVTKELTAPYTSNNKVTALIDGKQFMSNLRDEIWSANICLLKDPDFVLIAGWEFWQYRALAGRVTNFDGDPPRPVAGPNSPDPNFLPALLGSAVAQGAAVRVLAFRNPLPGPMQRTENFVDAVKALSDTKASACRDKTSDFAMSHHQKEVFIARSRFQDSRAYVGGMDLAVDRWDTSSHDAKVLECYGRNFGWHDIQVVVQGDAIVQLWANFAERWKDVQNRKDLLDCPVPSWKQDTWGQRPKMGNQHVQVLRTVAPTSPGNAGRFMPFGERTVLCALKKAIAKAECYIYIEEQFLWDCELADFIASQKKANSNLHLIIVMTAGCELPFDFKPYAFHLRSEFFRKVMDVGSPEEIEFGNKHKVYPYGLFQTPTDGGKEIYVHSKLVIVDDRYVAIGSANVDARSLHIETELHLGIVDGDTLPSKLRGNNTTVCKFAKELRDRLWKEHLGLYKPTDPPLPDDPIDVLQMFPGVSAWPKKAKHAENGQKHHLRCYINDPGKDLWREKWRRFIDRSERHW